MRRTKLLQGKDKNKNNNHHSPSLILDSLYLSLCIELAYDGTRELLVAVLGIAFLGGQLLSRNTVDDDGPAPAARRASSSL